MSIGTQVSVYGTLGPRVVERLAPQSNYSIDGSPPDTYQAVQTSSVQYSTRFYASPRLSNGQHTLLVTNLITSDFLFLDYFLVLRADPDTAPPQLLPSTGRLPTQSPSPPAANTVEGKPSSNSNTGTIVGSAIGAAALVILAVAAMLWLRSRDKRTWPEDTRVNSCTCILR